MSTAQQFKAGKARGEGAAKADQWVQSAKDTSDSITGSDSAQAARENKEQAAGFLQQTGEQVTQMAQGAADAVKNAVGMGNSSPGSGAATTHNTTTTTTTKHRS